VQRPDSCHQSGYALTIASYCSREIAIIDPWRSPAGISNRFHSGTPEWVVGDLGRRGCCSVLALIAASLPWSNEPYFHTLCPDGLDASGIGGTVGDQQIHLIHLRDHG